MVLTLVRVPPKWCLPAVCTMNPLTSCAVCGGHTDKGDGSQVKRGPGSEKHLALLNVRIQGSLEAGRWKRGGDRGGGEGGGKGEEEGKVEEEEMEEKSEQTENPGVQHYPLIMESKILSMK